MSGDAPFALEFVYTPLFETAVEDLLAYAKNERADLTMAHKRSLRALVKELEQQQ